MSCCPPNPPANCQLSPSNLSDRNNLLQYKRFARQYVFQLQQRAYQDTFKKIRPDDDLPKIDCIRWPMDQAKAQLFERFDSGQLG